jgi:hypothetical protein
MENFAAWIRETTEGRPTFVSDNNGFDWQFINWYFWHFTGGNSFGHSSTNLGSLYWAWSRTHSRQVLDDLRGGANTKNSGLTGPEQACAFAQRVHFRQ